jgi:hypothetical protein
VKVVEEVEVGVVGVVVSMAGGSQRATVHVRPNARLQLNTTCLAGLAVVLAVLFICVFDGD